MSFFVGVSRQLTRRSLNLEIVKNVHASMMYYADISYMLILLVCVWFDLCGLYHGTTVRAPQFL